MKEITKGMEVTKLLKQVMDVLRKTIKFEFKNMKLTGPQVMLMRILFHSGKMRISDLSEKLALSNSTVSGIIDRLEKQGFVERIRSEKDRRVVFVNVTPKFKKSSEKQFEKFENKLEVLMNTASQDELNTIIEGLEVLKTVIKRQNIDQTNNKN